MCCSHPLKHNVTVDPCTYPLQMSPRGKRVASCDLATRDGDAVVRKRPATWTAYVQEIDTAAMPEATDKNTPDVRAVTPQQRRVF